MKLVSKKSVFAMASLCLLASENAFSAHSGNAAPSVYLNYQTSKKYADILINTVRIDVANNTSYYAGIGGGVAKVENGKLVQGENGFYCGMQQPTEPERNFIYSIWNPYIRLKSGSSVRQLRNTDSFHAQAGDQVIEGNQVIYTFDRDMEVSIVSKDDVVSIIDKADSTVLKRANEEAYLGASYVGEKATTATFTGEGRGLQSFTKNAGWSTDSWYTLFTRVWEDGGSKFGFWFYDHAAKKWGHQVTMSYPDDNMKYNVANMYSFIEDWSGDNGYLLRKYHTNNTWVRYVDGEWEYINKVKIGEVVGDSNPTEGRCRNYYHNYDAGVDEDGFFLASGNKATTPVHSKYNELAVMEPNNYVTYLGAIVDSPIYDALQIENASVSNGVINWTLKEGTLPQFAVKYVIWDLDADVVVDTLSKYMSDTTSVAINKQLSGNYSIMLTLTDILDNTDSYVIEYNNKPSEIEGNSCVGVLGNVAAHSWGTMVEVPVQTQGESVEVNIVDENMNIAVPNNYGVQYLHGVATHSLYFDTQNLSVAGNYYITATVGEKSCKSKFSVAKGMYDEEESVDGINGIKYVYSTTSGTIVGFNSDSDANVNIEIVAPWGWMVTSQVISVKRGFNELQINANGLSVDNMYLLNVTANGVRFSENFIVK
ncbi:MAG: DUF3472 domain-containing protein [Paludibacteraceae bacterium]|nr:DUF3472 domain-containing protein [Paludibacteraceae bacterium]